MNNISIIEFIEDPNLINDQSLSLPQKVALKVCYGEPLTPGERSIYRKCTGISRYKLREYAAATFICGRKSGKSDKLASNIAIYEAAFREHEKHLSVGERGVVVLVAVNKRQARILYQYILAKLQVSPVLSRLIQNVTAEEIELTNRINIAIYPCSMRSIRGLSIICFIGDETAFFKYEGIDVDKEVINSVKPSLIQFPYSKLIKVSTPYAKRGTLYEDYKDHYGKDSEILVWQAGSDYMNPTISKKLIERELKKDYSFATGEYLARFREDLETFLPTEMIEAAVIPNRWELPKVENVDYSAFTDPSGGRADSFTLAIAHREGDTKKIIIDRLEERRPPFGPQDIAKEFSEILKSYGIYKVTGDRYAGEWVSKAFRDEGITFDPSKLNKSEIYLEFEPLLAQGRVDLLDNKRLSNQLKGLERRTRSGGKDLVDHYPGGQDDLANAVAGAIVASARKSIYGVDFGLDLLDPEDDEHDEDSHIKDPRWVKQLEREIKDSF